MNQYFQGSFLKYNLSIKDAEKYNLTHPFIDISSQNYVLEKSGNISIKEISESFPDMMRLLVLNKEGKEERSYIFIFSEDYHSIILDLTKIEYHREPKEIYKKKLIPYIRKIIRDKSIEELVCNWLNTVKEGFISIYIIG